MIKSLRIIVLLSIAIVVFSSLSLLVYASSSVMEFTVNPVIPENQQGESTSYFDLRVSKGTTQTIQLAIGNLSNRKMLIDIEVIPASTTGNGVVDYINENSRDSSLNNSLADMATISESLVEIPAGESKIVDVTIKMPNKSFDGIILGSISVTDITDRGQDKAAENTEEFNMKIRNEYEYVIAVVLQENDNVIDSSFELGKVYTVIEENEQVIVADIRNTQPKLLKNLRFNATVTKVDSEETIYNIVDKQVSFAPNSVMAYAFRDAMIEEVPPGEYIFTGSITEGEKTWEFSEKLKVDEQGSAEAKEAIAQQIQTMFKENNILLTVAIVMVLLLIVAVIIMAIASIIKKKRIK